MAGVSTAHIGSLDSRLFTLGKHLLKINHLDRLYLTDSKVKWCDFNSCFGMALFYQV